MPLRLRNMTIVLVLCGLASVPTAFAALGERSADVASSKHNLSVAGPGTVTASTETEICVFCHTPHASNTNIVAPLWNRSVNTQGAGGTTYDVYASSSLDAGNLDQPLGSSKLCLSCHDGTLAIGAVLNQPGSGLKTGNISMTGTADRSGTAGFSSAGIASGNGDNTGFTRFLGTDLRNDHPISLNYTSALASTDGELNEPGPVGDVSIGKRLQGGTKHDLPLEATNGEDGQVQCGSCHDPHLVENIGGVTGKFLRLNRFQKSNLLPSAAGGFDSTKDIICLACHAKDGWRESAHANYLVTDGGTPYTYSATAAAKREFPSGITVHGASCLNCHDTHTVSGSRRLLREGVNSGFGGGSTDQGFYKLGDASYDKSEIQETCYQCHQASWTSGDQGQVLAGSNTPPDIKKYFDDPGTSDNYHMPIKTSEQGKTTSAGAFTANTCEVHDIGTGGSGGTLDICGTATNRGPIVEGDTRGQDFIEDDALLGYVATGDSVARHVECTDCHNPHRVVKERCFNGDSGTDCTTAGNVESPDSEGTHQHARPHTNIASGVLRGIWGVEPQYSNSSFFANPTSFDVKRGMPIGSASPCTGGDDTSVDCSWVTREYQVCMKCHSNYAYTTPPYVRISAARNGLTSRSDQNGLTQYTNQAREFQAPSTHAGDSDVNNLGIEAGAGDAATILSSTEDWDTNNHRSWHPIMAPTERTDGLRHLAGNTAWNSPFNDSAATTSDAVGVQTMYCSDCHGPNASTANSVEPDSGDSWGPHGSSNPFILKYQWDDESNNSDTNNLCYKCHTPTDSSGFQNADRGNLHQYHLDKVGLECTWCHIAVPHGWKNRSLLVNLNDVGSEADPTNCPNGGCEVAMNGNSDYYTQPPYYWGAKNKIRTFPAPNTWDAANCGSAGGTTAVVGGAPSGTATLIASTNGETNNSATTGENWMRSVPVCDNPP